MHEHARVRVWLFLSSVKKCLSRSAATVVLAARVLSIGEMFRTYWETEPLHARLRDLGYRQFEELRPVEIVARF